MLITINISASDEYHTVITVIGNLCIIDVVISKILVDFVNLNPPWYKENDADM
jgi:hypothetical protein